MLLLLMLQLINNVNCVFTKFVSEGKCTIRLREPPIDICVSKVHTTQVFLVTIFVAQIEFFCISLWIGCTVDSDCLSHAVVLYQTDVIWYDWTHLMCWIILVRDRWQEVWSVDGVECGWIRLPLVCDVWHVCILQFSTCTDIKHFAALSSIHLFQRTVKTGR